MHRNLTSNKGKTMDLNFGRHALVGYCSEILTRDIKNNGMWTEFNKSAEMGDLRTNI